VSLLNSVILKKSWNHGEAPEPHHILSCITNVLRSSVNTQLPKTKFCKNANSLLNVKMLTSALD